MMAWISKRLGDQGGQMLVAVIVLLTLMFFIGTAMALAVSSSLHTIAQTNSMDAADYAAESAVALGTARARGGEPPSPSKCVDSLDSGDHKPRVNGQDTAADTCYVSVQTADVQTWAVRDPAPLKSGQCLPGMHVFSGPVPPATEWGVIGVSSTSLTKLQLSIASAPCASGGDTDKCSQATSPDIPNVIYFQCSPESDEPALKIVNQGASTVNLTAFVVRAAQVGSDCMATTIGQAHPLKNAKGRTVVDEADWRLPGCGWGNATQILWNRVLP